MPHIYHVPRGCERVNGFVYIQSVLSLRPRTRILTAPADPESEEISIGFLLPPFVISIISFSLFFGTIGEVIVRHRERVNKYCLTSGPELPDNLVLLIMTLSLVAAVVFFSRWCWLYRRKKEGHRLTGPADSFAPERTFYSGLIIMSLLLLLASFFISLNLSEIAVIEPGMPWFWILSLLTTIPLYEALAGKGSKLQTEKPICNVVNIDSLEVQVAGGIERKRWLRY